MIINYVALFRLFFISFLSLSLSLSLFHSPFLLLCFKRILRLLLIILVIPLSGLLPIPLLCVLNSSCLKCLLRLFVCASVWTICCVLSPASSTSADSSFVVMFVFYCDLFSPSPSSSLLLCCFITSPEPSLGVSSARRRDDPRRSTEMRAEPHCGICSANSRGLSK